MASIRQNGKRRKCRRKNSPQKNREATQTNHNKEDIVMAGKNTAVFGIYPTCEAAERGVDALKAAGFRNTDISVLLPQNVGSKDLAHEKHTKAPEGATAGAGTGALLGGE